jgi:hypothetical protein
MISHHTPNAKHYRHVTHNEIFKTPNTNNSQRRIMAPLIKLIKFWSAADQIGHLIAVPKVLFLQATKPYLLNILHMWDQCNTHQHQVISFSR